MDSESNDQFKDGCGVMGIIGHPEASKMAYLGLHALQHRGQESSGIVSSDGTNFYREVAMGLVADIFTQDKLDKLHGNIAIGHNRYSTTGSSHIKNCQPILVDYALGPLAIAHNGNFVNDSILRDQLEAYGSIFHSTMDTEVMVHLIAKHNHGQLLDRIIGALHIIKGAYSIVVMDEKNLFAVRDPAGFRPLLLGKIGDAYVVASETCAFDLIEAKLVREIEPGELIHITDKGEIKSYHPFPKAKISSCVFEFVYFARPDSYIFGHHVSEIRRKLGRELARTTHVDADIVIPIPDSGMQAALGYSEESGIPFDLGLTRNHYTGRTFIEPEQSIRHFGVKLKLNPIRSVIAGKRVIVIDDSIVRGTTSRKIIKMIREAGAKEVHMRISSPPTSYPCYYGIDTPSRKELIAATHSIEEITKYITADSLAYLDIENMLNVFGENSKNFCSACFSGNYPIEFCSDTKTRQMRLFE